MVNEVAIREDKAVALYELETRFAIAVRQRELLDEYIKERLKPDKHFYTVGEDPGRKPSLTKEGAELICLPHALKGHYQWLFGPENPPLDDTPYQITINCELEATGKFAGEGVGSASSMITKKTGERVQRQKDPGLRHNATIKMACKSAYIAATLNSTAASEFFTQDLEDDQTGSHGKANPKEHWCKEHNTPFFKKGKMKSYAHPIGDTGEWCHEHTDNKPPAKDETETKESEPEKPGEQQEQEKPKNKIDMTWLNESIETLQGKVPKTWGDDTVLPWMLKSYGVEGKTILEASVLLDDAKAKHFVNKVNDALNMA